MNESSRARPTVAAEAHNRQSIVASTLKVVAVVVVAVAVAFKCQSHKIRPIR